MILMKKITAICTIICLFTAFSFSQSRFNAGASFNLGFPVGAFSEVAKTGIGGSLVGEYMINNNISFLLSVSYQNFPGDFNKFAVGGKVYDVSVNAIPILLGAKYYFNRNYFCLLETGVNLLRVSADVSDIFNKEKLSTEFEAKFGIGLGVGYRYQLAEQSILELRTVLILLDKL